MIAESPLVATCIILIVAGACFAFAKRRPRYTSKPLCNKSERDLFAVLLHSANSFDPSLNVFVQVAYAEFLRSSTRGRLWEINARRADFVIADSDFNVKLVVEYQGAGHYGKGRSDRKRAIAGDRIKRRATSSANIPFFEVPAKFDRHQTATRVKTLLQGCEK